MIGARCLRNDTIPFLTRNLLRLLREHPEEMPVPFILTRPLSGPCSCNQNPDVRVHEFLSKYPIWCYFCAEARKPLEFETF